MTAIARASTLLALVLTTSPALAKEPQTISQRVNVADLNLSTKAGVDRLRFRVAAAAYAVCGDELQRMAMDDFVEIEQCVHQVKSSTDKQIAALIPKKVQTASAR